MGLLDMFTRAQVVASAISVADTQAGAYLKIKIPFETDNERSPGALMFDGGKDGDRVVALSLRHVFGTMSLKEAKNLHGALEKMLHSLAEVGYIVSKD